MHLRSFFAGLSVFLIAAAAFAAETVRLGELEIEEKYVFVDKDNITHVYLTYDNLEYLSDILYEKLKAKNIKLKGLVSIPRGGLEPTCKLSQRIGKEQVLGDDLIIKTHHLKSYSDENKQEAIRELSSVELENQGEGWVYVDDLTDKGQTFGFIANKYPKALRICWIAKPQGEHSAHYYAIKVPQETWIVFAYEQKLIDFYKDKALAETQINALENK